jgi:hypothetical protein
MPHLDQHAEPDSRPPPPPGPREFVERPKSLEELRQRPRFVHPLKVTPEVKLVDVLTMYSFEKKEPCGLSNCSQWHYDGYLVITSTGAETNIGNKCGRNAFGIEFKSARARYKRDEDRRVTVGRALELQAEAPRVKQRISELANRAYGVRWIYTLREAVRAAMGRQGFDHLKWRAARGDYAVTHVKEVPRKDSDSGTSGKARSKGQTQYHYITERLGTLAPMDWLEWDFNAHLFKGVRDNFAVFGELAPTGMETRKIKEYLKKVEGWEQELRAAEFLLTQALRFLAPENLQVVDLAIKELRSNSGTNAKSLVDWSKTAEYGKLLAGTFRDGQPIG